MQKPAMQKPAVAVVALFLASSLFAQPSNPPRQVVISNLVFTGVTHLSTVDLQSITEEVQSTCCARYHAEEIRERIQNAFQERGYFKALVESPTVVVLSKSAMQGSIAVSVRVDEGAQYRLREITFTDSKSAFPAEGKVPVVTDSPGPLVEGPASHPSPCENCRTLGLVFPRNQLRGLFAIANGDIFNVEKIRLGLEGLRQKYASQGYINFTPVPNTETDDETATISLLIYLDEGKQFHFGGLVVDGDERQAGTGAKLIADWKPHESKVLSPELLDQFGKRSSR